MPDITMCNGKGCPLKDTCYRYKAKPDELWQSYFMEEPYEDGDCREYWPTKESQKWEICRDDRHRTRWYLSKYGYTLADEDGNVLYFDSPEKAKEKADEIDEK